jgi:predicted esterase
VEFARRANELLTAGGLAVDYVETDAGHWLPPEAVAPARELVATSTA